MQQSLNHLAIIMDGNRRWANAHGFEILKGHHQGADTLKVVSRAAIEYKIRWLTVFAFSSENWQRPSSEVAGLLALMKRFILTQSQELIDQNIRLRIVGRRDRFSDELQSAIRDVENRSSGNSGLNLTVALDYGGRQDIAAAAAQIAHEVETGLLKASQVNDDLLKSRLSTSVLPPVDLLIRTGGEKRISNFYFGICITPNFISRMFIGLNSPQNIFRKPWIVSRCVIAGLVGHRVMLSNFIW